MDRTAIFAALQWECAAVLRQLRQVSRELVGTTRVWRSLLAGREIWLVKTGIGIDRAAAAAREVIAPGRFDLIVSTGCAGALTADLRPGDVVIATAVGTCASGQRYVADDRHRERLCSAAKEAGLQITLGPVLCSAEALTTAAAKQAAATAHGAVAVEMEGAAIAAVAARDGIPFVSVRAILDTADTELTHTGHFIEPQTGALKPLALAGYLATHPRAVAELLVMQRMMRAAQTSLARFFGAWI